jgi:uncharacterized protein (DUF427 family)
MWNYRGKQRPQFADPTGPGQESVWDYPRPPALVACEKLIKVKYGDRIIGRSDRCLRILETASPPTYYLPPDDIDMRQVQPTSGSSFCEWKGSAQYWSLAQAPDKPPVGWSYPHPNPAFKAIENWLCFYPSRVSCFIDGEIVRAQASEFYGGWITDEIIGPFKGDPGTGHW